MKKIIKDFWTRYCQPAMLKTTAELDDSLALTQLARDVGQSYEQRRRQKLTTDADLASKFEKLFDNNLVAMSFYDHDGHLINLNKKMRELCAIDTLGDEYFRNTRLFDTPSFHGEFTPDRKEPFRVCQHMYFPELNIDRYIEVNIIPTFDQKGQFRYYVITSRDVTNERLIYLEQQQRAEEQQQISKAVGEFEHRLNYLLRSANMYVWWLDMKAQVISFTRSLSRQEFSETVEQYVGALFPEERQGAIDHMKEIAENPHAFNVRHQFLHTPINPNPQSLYINGQPLLDDKGRIIALFGILRDVTRMMEKELHKEQERAKQSAYLKSTFLANMSHELRTPLNAIVGFSDLLPMVENGKERDDMLRIILGNCDQLLRLVNDILEVSDLGLELVIEPTDIDFAVAFDDICQTLRQRVDAAGVDFIVENPYPHFFTRLDRGRIQQVITNFVTNAVKFTTEGHIRVGYKLLSEAPLAPSAPSAQGLYVYCEDTGAGIPKEKQATVFERFVKLNEKVQGTGLGLSISKNIIERCGGKIGLDSEGEGHGSTFWFWIPCEGGEEMQ